MLIREDSETSIQILLKSDERSVRESSSMTTEGEGGQGGQGNVTHPGPLTFRVPTRPAGLWASFCTFSLLLLLVRAFLGSSLLLVFLAHVLIVGPLLRLLPASMPAHLQRALQTLRRFTEAPHAGVGLRGKTQTRVYNARSIKGCSHRLFPWSSDYRFFID